MYLGRLDNRSRPGGLPENGFSRVERVAWMRPDRSKEVHY